MYRLTSDELYWHAALKIGSRPRRSTEQCHFIGLDRRVAGEGIIQLEYIEVRRAAVNHNNSNVLLLMAAILTSAFSSSSASS